MIIARFDFGWKLEEGRLNSALWNAKTPVVVVPCVYSVVADREEASVRGVLGRYPLAEAQEVFLLRRNNIVFSARGPSFGELRATGDAYMTSKRLVLFARNIEMRNLTVIEFPIGIRDWQGRQW